MRRGLAFAILLLAVLPGAASAEWRSLRTEHFQVMGDVSTGQLRDVAVRFEQFREVVTQILPAALRGGGPPVIVLVFPDYRANEPFMPRANGRTVPVAGMFVGGPDVNYITVSLESGEQAFPIVFHEYSHLILNRVFAHAPLWFKEGLAEYYSTFELANGNRTARIGRPIARHVLLLRERRMTLSQLFAIGHESKEYNTDGLPRSILYAQSWAVVHHAIHGEPRRRDALIGLVQRLASGAGVEDSLQATYKMPLEQLDGEVQGYVRRQIYQHSEYDFTTSIVAKVAGEAVRIEPADVEAVLGDFLAHQRRDAEAEARLTKALAARPNLPRAHAALGLMRWWQGKRAEALPHLEKAVAGGSTNETAYYAYGYALATDGTRDDARMLQAEAALERALELRPGYPAAQELLAYVYHQRKEYAKVRDLLAPVVKAAPSNHDAALLLAAGFLGLNDTSAARPLLGPILATATDDSVKKQARALLSQLAAIENGSQARSEANAIGIGIPSSVEPAAPQQPRQSGPILSLRPLQAGEQRTAGTFEAIECGEKGVTIVLATPSGPIRASVAEFSAITFVTFRSETGGSISCGAKPKLPALLTWRWNGTTMSAVAVEVVPDGYVP